MPKIESAPESFLISTRKEATMPKGTKVDAEYQALKAKGYDEGSAARIAQANTGKSLATGKAPKSKSRKKK
jgi:hypothetical protein